MSYFSKDFIAFFLELEKNNHKAWFDENRKRYETSVKKPFQSFVQEMIKRIQAVDPEIQLEPKNAIFRINRDIRFSQDKSLYKTHMAAIISPQGRKDHQHPGLYFQFGGEKAWIGGGAYQLEKDTLQKLREHIATHPGKLEKLSNQKEFKAKFGELKGEKNKVLPKEFKDAAQEQPLLFNKQFYYMVETDADIILKPNLPEIMMDYYMTAKPVNDYLKEAMGIV
ncbi:MAG: DUF2461 domain-containing protein [Bacteroidia bacterium]